MWSKVHVSQDDYILVGVCYRGPEADDDEVNLCKIGQLNKKKTKVVVVIIAVVVLTLTRDASRAPAGFA